MELIKLQSNHEGVLVDTFEAHIDDVDGAIINAAGTASHLQHDGGGPDSAVFQHHVAHHGDGMEAVGYLQEIFGAWLSVASGQDRSLGGVTGQRAQQALGNPYGTKSLTNYLNRRRSRCRGWDRSGT